MSGDFGGGAEVLTQGLELLALLVLVAAATVLTAMGSWTAYRAWVASRRK